MTTTTNGGTGKSRVANRIRKRPVSFGNPALGTYHGFVYTEERLNSSPPPLDHQRPLIEGAMEVRRLVAVLDVPPEQVPEGILNLARPHRPWINHLRIVIAEPATQKGSSFAASTTSAAQEEGKEETKEQESSESTATNASYSPFSPSPNASAMEGAASILAAEQHQAQGSSRNAMDENEMLNSSEHHRNGHHDRSYLVLIELSSEEAAEEMVRDLDGEPYTILDETVTCTVHHVVALEGVAGVTLMSPFFAPHTEASSSGKLEILPSHTTPANDKVAAAALSSERESGSTKPTATTLTEDYNCAVCLEHMELDSPHTSVLTTVCNHSFHMDCLMQWQDSPCPVCRYDHSGLNEALSQCHLCGTTENNYVCLICGVVSCGGALVASVARQPDSEQCGGTASAASLDDAMESLQASQSRMLSTSHARKHYNDTLHAYALCTETQHVWDFAGNGYVHRLLQNKEDGKLVEVSDPSNTTSHERSLSPGLSEAQEEQVVHRKLEGFASQYYTLLKSQLEQQRIFYEGRLSEIRREYSDTRKQRVSTADLITALKQEQHQLSQRLGSVQTKCRKVQEDVGFIKSLNESLEDNREPLRKQVEQAQRDRLEARKMFEACLPPLQEKVTRLMLQLESNFDGSVGGGAGDGSGNGGSESTDSSPKKPAAR